MKKDITMAEYAEKLSNDINDLRDKIIYLDNKDNETIGLHDTYVNHKFKEIYRLLKMLITETNIELAYFKLPKEISNKLKKMSKNKEYYYIRKSVYINLLDAIEDIIQLINKKKYNKGMSTKVFFEKLFKPFF